MKIYQKLLHLNCPIGKRHGLSNMVVPVDMGYGLNLVNLEYHQYLVEPHPILGVIFSFLKNMDNVDSSNIS